jgi:hypothetical protein
MASSRNSAWIAASVFLVRSYLQRVAAAGELAGKIDCPRGGARIARHLRRIPNRRLPVARGGPLPSPAESLRPEAAQHAASAAREHAIGGPQRQEATHLPYLRL